MTSAAAISEGPGGAGPVVTGDTARGSPESSSSLTLPLALRLLAIELLLRPMGPWGLRPLILITAALTLVWPRALTASVTWYAVAGLVAARIASDWPLADNHIYLLAYFCLAAALALGSPAPARTLATSSRLLIGGAFTLAVLWKAVLSPDYLDGRFFEVTFLADARFEDAVKLLSGMSAEDLAANRSALTPLPHDLERAEPPTFIEPPAFLWMVRLATWGGLALEAAVAAACLLPFGGRAVVARHIVLLLFCLITYALAPVAGFGWLLLAMGLTLEGADRGVLRILYVAAWLIVLVYAEVPWAGVIGEYLGQP